MAFKCPDGYDELAIEASDLLSVEDVQDDDTELYLIKAPTNITFDPVQRESIDLERMNSNPGSFRDSHSYHVEPANSCELQSCLLLLPSKCSSSLQPVSKAFKGQIVFSGNLDIPAVCIPSLTKKFPVFPDGLHQRFKPFGSGNPVVHKKSKKMKSEKRKSKDSNNVINCVTPELHHVSKKKTKKKKKG